MRKYKPGLTTNIVTAREIDSSGIGRSVHPKDDGGVSCYAPWEGGHIGCHGSTALEGELS